MKKITLLLLFTLFSCGISYDGEERLVLQTAVVDRYGNPLKDIETLVEISENSTTENISNGLSDSSGNKTLVFPAPSNGLVSVYFTDFKNEYATKRIYQIELNDFVNYKLALENVVLYKLEDITTLQIDTQSNSGNSLRLLSISGQYPQFSESFHPQNQQDDGYIETYFQVLKNQQVILNYTVRNNTDGSLTDYSVPIDIGNGPVQYTLNY